MRNIEEIMTSVQIENNRTKISTVEELHGTATSSDMKNDVIGYKNKTRTARNRR